MQPRIGMPLCLDTEERFRAGRRYHYVHEAYARAVAAAGGMPLYLPLQADASQALAGMDGLLIPGGDDLPPPQPIPGAELSLVPEEQCAFDLSLLRAARRRGLPVLGICYGMQLMALAAGGRLLHHLPSDRPGAPPHRLPEATGRHDLTPVAGSRLVEILGDALGPVNSLHHQGVADPGPGLRVAAHARDGLIEALEADPTSAQAPAGFWLGVQWHPELLADPHRSRLFGAFLEAAGGG